MPTEATTTVVKSTSRRTEPTTTTHRQTLGRAIRSEWIKLRTLRSTWIGMGAVILLLVGLGAIAAAVSTGSAATPEEGGGFGNGDPLSTVLTGADFAVLLVGVLGALAGAREYGSRMILATIAAAPLTLIRLPPADHIALWPLSSGPRTILCVLCPAAESVRSQRRRTGAGTTAPRRWRADGRSLCVR